MRLDKFLTELNIATRSQAKQYVRQGLVSVNGVVAKSADQKIDENKDIISFRGSVLSYQKYVYYMLNKPAGVVSATQDNVSKTVMDLLQSADKREDLFPVGRLDKDTEGLLLLTNDGELAHRLLSPKKHVDKTYLVSIECALSEEEIRRLEEGVDIGEEQLTMPAKVTVVEERKILLTIHEGKFHQVKRMLMAVGNHVTALKRVSFGALTLDKSLLPGQYRALTAEEVNSLHEA
jgi:16S rRNA pseudouridine516 synthase